MRLFKTTIPAKMTRAILLVTILLLFIFLYHTEAFAETFTLASGTDGNITWKAVYDPDALYVPDDPDSPFNTGMRILYLSGSGDMNDYSDGSYGGTTPPWHTSKGYMSGYEYNLFEYNKIEIGSGITSIGECAFNYSSISWNHPPKEINIPDTVKRIGAFAFTNVPSERIIVPDSVTSIGKLTFAPQSTIVCKSGTAAYDYCIANNQLMEITDLDLSFTVGGSSSVTLKQGETVSYSITSNIETVQPKVEVDNTNLISVDTSAHTITATGSGGTAVLTAYFHGAKWECTVTVPEETEDVSSGSNAQSNEQTNAGSSRAAKSKQPMKAKGKTVKIKYSKLKKKAQTIKISKAATIKNYKGKLSFKKIKGNKKITINKKTGRIKVGKKLKKGTYTVKIKVTAAGNSKYKKGSKTITVRIRVK